jgi:tetratricopeptide (TPR) repeat protein
MKSTVIVLGLLVLTVPGFSQGTGPDIEKYMQMINTGKADEVRTEIPSLLAQYPNNPGVLYVQGLVTTEWAEAVRIYQSVVDNFPRSEWADDALYKVYQYYYALGLYRTAELKLEQLRKDYPNSKYVQSGGEPAVKSLAEEKRSDSVTVSTARSGKSIEPSQQFTLQVGAYTAQVNAEKQKLFFEDLGYAVEVVSKVKENRSLFLVLVGTYASAEEAKGKAEVFRQKYNIESLVVAK